MTAVVDARPSTGPTGSRVTRAVAPARCGSDRAPASLVAITSAIAAMAFLWPLLASCGSVVVAHSTDAPWLFAAVLPLVIAVVLADVADGGLDAKGVALLGVLSAAAAAMRPFGSGHAGFEPMWIVVILGGRALGPGFGFCLGAIGMFSSALVTGGVGPWLPFQMIGAAWIGLGAGLLPRASGRREIGAAGGVLRGGVRGLRLPAQPVVLAVPHRRRRVPARAVLRARRADRW